MELLGTFHEQYCAKYFHQSPFVYIWFSFSSEVIQWLADKVNETVQDVHCAENACVGGCSS